MTCTIVHIFIWCYDWDLSKELLKRHSLQHHKSETFLYKSSKVPCIESCSLISWNPYHIHEIVVYIMKCIGTTTIFVLLSKLKFKFLECCWKSFRVFAVVSLIVFHLFLSLLFYCGEVYIKFTILIILKCTVQWH